MQRVTLTADVLGHISQQRCLFMHPWKCLSERHTGFSRFQPSIGQYPQVLMASHGQALVMTFSIDLPSTSGRNIVGRLLLTWGSSTRESADENGKEGQRRRGKGRTVERDPGEIFLPPWWLHRPIHNKATSGFLASRQARAPVAGLEPATGGSLQSPGLTPLPTFHSLWWWWWCGSIGGDDVVVVAVMVLTSCWDSRGFWGITTNTGFDRFLAGHDR
ncbi:hypothetical protein PoB_000645700 [Plakobranchus ocellatus]|uniref:Uncharacterized protein n=1 Tax=Plakobranchus ocellatus TaxID=259542 RepID=A0AAV3YAU5_9GAST|nr:hypothetical protein PoB_000645700 [Plakobranchus ocellatus]